MLIVISLVCIITGYILLKFTPKKPNYAYGYRTKWAMKNKDTWEVAQKYAARTLIKIGYIYAAVHFIFKYSLENVPEGLQVAVFIGGIIILVILVERHLRKIFKEDGTRK